MVIEIVDLPIKSMVDLSHQFFVNVPGASIQWLLYIPILSPLPGLVNVNKKTRERSTKNHHAINGKTHYKLYSHYHQ